MFLAAKTVLLLVTTAIHLSATTYQDAPESNIEQFLQGALTSPFMSIASQGANFVMI